MAINDPKWSNGSIVLIQSVGDEPTVRWLVGSTVFDAVWTAAGGLSIPVAMHHYKQLSGS